MALGMEEDISVFCKTIPLGFNVTYTNFLNNTFLCPL